jgi:hypothetical protein
VPKKPSPGPGKDNLIPLSRWRAALARARTSRRPTALVELPDAARVIPTLPIQDLYYTIKDIGLADSHDLLALASPAQVRGFLDLDVWDGDRIVEERLREWLDLLIDLGPDRLSRSVHGLDSELPSLWLALHTRIYDLSLGEAPTDDISNPLVPTPDRFFLLEITASGESARTCERLIDHLYRADPDLARRVVQGAKWELPSELEEQSYRWRRGRMADMGFVDYYEALEIYRYLDPQSVTVGEGSSGRARGASAEEPAAGALPAPFVDPLAGDSFFHQAAARIEAESRIATLHAELVELANRVMAADKIDPADPAAARDALSRALSYLSIGLEYISRGDIAIATTGLSTVAPVRLLRVGVSLTLTLGRLANTLARAGRARFEPPWDPFVAALRERVPRLWLPGEAAARPFRTVADVRQAAHLLEEATFQGVLVIDRLRLDAPEVPFGALFRTAAVQSFLGREFAARPLTSHDLGAARTAAFDAAGRLKPERRAEILARVRASGDPDRAEAVATAWLDELERELGGLDPSRPPDPHFVGGLLLA